MTSPILIANQLSMSFKRPKEMELFKGLDLSVNPGESVCIMGRSGEGKSTLLNLLGTLDSPSSGTIRIAGQRVNAMTATNIRRKHLGFVFQSFHLMNEFTVYENVILPARIIRSIPDPSVIEELLRAVGLWDRKDHLAKLLSGGEKQRVAIARALCNQPDVILADEPSGNLDATTAAEIHRLLIDFAKQKGHSIVVVTHNEAFSHMCDVIYTLQDKRLERVIN